MSDSRKQILEYLKRQGTASVSEMGDSLELTQVTIRHHLKKLLEDGLIDIGKLLYQRGPGRPRTTYHLTPLADFHLPRNYTFLCKRLIEYLSSTYEVPQLIDLFLVAGERSAEYVLRKYHLNEEQRLSITFDYLDYHGYLPSIERTHRDLHILVNNCPYLEALKLTPELCHYDKGLIQTLMGSQGSMRSLVTSSEPCIFRFASIS